MKKNLIVILSLILLANTSTVKAVSDENVTERRREKAVEIQEIRTERKENREEKREEVKETLEAKRSKIAQNHANRLQKRFSAYDSRLSNIITRFESRLAELKAKNISVTAIETELTTAKSKLESAKLKGLETIAAFKAIDPSSSKDQKVALQAAKDLATETHKLYEDAHTALKSALKLLKVVSKPALPAASAAVNNSL